MPSSPGSECHELLARVQADPTSVGVPEIMDCVAAEEVVEQTALRAICAILNANRASELARDLEPYVECADDHLRSTAVLLIAAVARADSSAVRPLIPTLTNLLSDEYLPVRHDALAALADIAEAYPENKDIHAAIPQLKPLLTDEYIHVRESAVEITAAVASADPEAIIDLVPALVTVIEEYSTETVDELVTGIESPQADRAVIASNEESLRATKELQDEIQRDRLRTEVMRETAAETLIPIAEEAPESVVAAVPRLLNVLEYDPIIPTRTAVLAVLRVIADAHPMTVVGDVDIIANALCENESPALQGAAARTLAITADTYPKAVADIVAPEAECVADLLAVNDVAVRGAAAALLAYVAEHCSNEVRRVRPALIDALDDEHPSVRGSTVWALGFISDEAARTSLREIAEADPDPAIRELATEILDRMAES